MAKPLIVARDLSIIYNQGKSNEFKALSGVSTDIFEGEYIILFGPSGCGKSTLMYSIQGSLPPGEGTLLIKGDDVYAYPPAERVYFQRHVMGIIFQQFNLPLGVCHGSNSSANIEFKCLHPAAALRYNSKHEYSDKKTTDADDEAVYGDPFRTP